MIILTNDNWADNEIQAFKLLFVQKMHKKSYDTEYLQGLVWQNNIF